MDPTTGNHSYYTPCTTHKLALVTGLRWTGMDYGRLVVLKRSLCNNATSYRQEVGGEVRYGTVYCRLLQS